jgi:hypothetical protein
MARVKFYIYGSKQTLERVLIAVHLMHHRNESNYPLDFMKKWHHHIKSQSDSDYLGHVDYEEEWIDTLDDPQGFRDDVSTLTPSDTKPDKFTVETDEDGNVTETGKEPFKATSDDQYMIPESENENAVMIRRSITGVPFKDASGNHIPLNKSIDESNIQDMPSEGEWVEKNIVYQFDGKLWGCEQRHKRMHYHPSETPALFTRIYNDFSQGYPEWEQPTGAHDAYGSGQIVTKNGVNYKSNIDANTYDPEVYNDETYPNTPSWQYWDKEPFE